MFFSVQYQLASELQFVAQSGGNLSTWISDLWQTSPLLLIACAVAILLGIAFALLIPRKRKSQASDSHEVVPQGPALGEVQEPAIEMKWRHEKLILADRQTEERHRRLADFTEWLGHNRNAELAYPGGALFFLGESIREERHEIGSEISKVNLMKDRLGRTESSREVDSSGAWQDELSSCLEDLNQQATILKARQGELRTILKSVTDLEEQFFTQHSDRSLDPGETEGRLSRVVESLDRLQGGLHGSVAVSGQRVATLIHSADENLPEKERSALVHFLEIVSIDSEPDSKKGKVALLAAAERALESFRHRHENSGEEGRRISEPDPGFRAPIFFDDRSPEHTNGLSSENVFTEDKLADDTDASVESDSAIADQEQKEAVAVEPAEDLPEDFSQVLFCSNKPEIWNQSLYRGRRERSRSLSEVPDGIAWVGLKRLDTGEQIFCNSTKSDLSASGDGFANGFNGSNELFYEARHLGMFSESCEGDVETRFTYGGWGFGHRVSGFDDAEGPPQASGWAGQSISADTVFEITVYKSLPESATPESVLPASDKHVAEVVR